MPLRSERRFINISKVTSGMMIEFTYSKKSGERGTYMVFVVDPNRTNDRATEPQLHGFVIDKMNDTELIEFLSSFRKGINIDFEDRRASIVEGIDTDEAYDTFKASKYVGERKYRTFNLSAMSAVRQILIGSVD